MTINEIAENIRRFFPYPMQEQGQHVKAAQAVGPLVMEKIGAAFDAGEEAGERHGLLKAAALIEALETEWALTTFPHGHTAEVMRLDLARLRAALVPVDGSDL